MKGDIAEHSFSTDVAYAGRKLEYLPSFIIDLKLHFNFFLSKGVTISIKISILKTHVIEDTKL